MNMVSGSLNLRITPGVIWPLSGIFLGMCLIVCPLKYVALVLFLCSYALCAYARPHWPIYVLILLTPIARVPGLDELIEPVILSMIFLSLLTWFIKLRVSTKENKWAFLQYKEFHLFFILFALLMMVSLINSVNMGESLRMMSIHLAGFLSMYYFLEVLRDDSYLKRAVYLFLCISLMIALLAFLQYLIMQYHVFMSFERFVIPAVNRLSLFGNDTVLNGGYRSVGTFYHSNNLGAYLALSLPILLSLLFSARNLVQRYFIALIGVIILAAVFFSGSRGALINIVISSLFLLAVYWGSISSRLKLLGALFIVLILLISSSHIISFLRLSSILSNRDIIWQGTSQLISEHPIVGHGMGTFSQEFFSRFGFPSAGDMETILDEILLTGDSNVFLGIHAHNLLLNYAFEMGIAAPLILLLFYFNYLRTFVRFIVRKKNDHTLRFALAVGASGALMGQFVHNFFETICFNYLPFSYSFIFVVAVGIILMHKQI